LIVAGELDPICGPAQARPISEGLPRATAALALIPDCGHLPAIEARDTYLEAVEGWLKALSS
jgi:pimeloyl-ACP methyl ester carboxylesterase